MSSRPWTPRTWVVAIVSMAASSTAVTLAGRGIWWPVVALAGVWLGIGIVGWWLWRDDRVANENENEEA